MSGRREVHHGDAIAWLRAHGPLAATSAVTSLPDLSELPALGYEGWQAWFVEAAELVLRSVPDGVAIFFQSDIRHRGLWVDKGALVARAGERAEAKLLFHRIVCRRPPGTVTMGRATYAHLLAFSRHAPARAHAAADVLPDGGAVAGRKAMGVRACAEAVRFIATQTPTRVVLDPFCGWGTTLAVANALGLDAIGVDRSASMCRSARTLQIAAGEL